MWESFLTDIKAIVADVETINAGNALPNVADALTRAGGLVVKIGSVWHSLFGGGVKFASPPMTDAEALACVKKCCDDCKSEAGMKAVTGPFVWAALLNLIQFILSFIQNPTPTPAA